MSHEKLHPESERLEAYAEGAMEDGDRVVLESHLLSCVRCQGEVEEWRALFAALEGLPRLAPSAGFADRVMARVRIPDPTATWQARAVAQVSRASQRVARWVPQTTRGWAWVVAFLALPVLLGGGALVWLLSRSYVTTEALWLAALGTLDNGAERVGSAIVNGAMQTDVAAWLTSTLSSFLQTAGMRGVGAALGITAVLTVLSIYVLYRNLIRTPTRGSSYATYSF